MDWKIVAVSVVIGVASVGCGGCGEEQPPPVDEGQVDETDEDAATESDEQEAREGTQQDDEDDDREWESRAERRTCSFFPDDCPPEQSCYLTSGGDRRCAQTGGRGEGESCRRANSCREGMICVGGSPGTCRAICRVDRGNCATGHNCIPLEIGGVSGQLGACEPPSDGCRLWPDDSCDLGEQCIVTPAGNRCRQTTPDAQIGAPCPEGPTQCQYGQTCVSIRGGDRECRAKCSDNESCERGTCAPLDNRPFGYCS